MDATTRRKADAATPPEQAGESEQVAGQEPQEQQEPGCVHHWVLGDPRNGRIVGTCRRASAIPQ